MIVRGRGVANDGVTPRRTLLVARPVTRTWVVAPVNRGDLAAIYGDWSLNFPPSVTPDEPRSMLEKSIYFLREKRDIRTVRAISKRRKGKAARIASARASKAVSRKSPRGRKQTADARRDGVSVARAGARRARGDTAAGVARARHARARLAARDARARGPHRVGPPARAPGVGRRAGPVLRGLRGRGGRPRVPPRRGRAPAGRRRARRGVRASVARGRGRGGTSRSDASRRCAPDVIFFNEGS